MRLTAMDPMPDSYEHCVSREGRQALDNHLYDLLVKAEEKWWWVEYGPVVGAIKLALAHRATGMIAEQARDVAEYVEGLLHLEDYRATNLLFGPEPEDEAGGVSEYFEAVMEATTALEAGALLAKALVNAVVSGR